MEGVFEYLLDALQDPLYMLCAALVAFCIVTRLVYSVYFRVGPLRLWLLVLAFFEVGPIVSHLVYANPLDGFATNLKDAPAERRLWCLFVAFLSFSRLLAFVEPQSRAVRMHLAAVHVVEVAYFFNEQRIYAATACPVGTGGEAPVAIDMGNFLWTKYAEMCAAIAAWMQSAVDIASCKGGGERIILGVCLANATAFTYYAFGGLEAYEAKGHGAHGHKRDGEHEHQHEHKHNGDCCEHGHGHGDEKQEHGHEHSHGHQEKQEHSHGAHRESKKKQ